MKREYAVLNTDRVNKKRILIPAGVLMHAEETNYREAILHQAAPGTPAHLQHDMHRVIGWSRQLGHYIDGEMVRVLGLLTFPESDQERVALQEQVNLYRRRLNEAHVQPRRLELADRIPGINLAEATFVHMEAVFAKKDALAVDLYPEYFEHSTRFVDKDGLVDYRILLERTTELLPGVFHDKGRDLLLVAHGYFRRQLSHLNSLNTEFLKTFRDVSFASTDVRPRLRLDPDLVGLPASAKEIMELEYWRGPPYDDDITKIRSGVAEYKADSQTRTFEGVDRTQIWWKDPETREADGSTVEYRTFEAEELIENPSAGLDGTHFGCRYVHAEYSSDAGAITHFDGAIRAYEGNAYLTRFDASIDRAGKHSDYKKLFRFDGALNVSDWKRLLSDYFRGNTLIPEYLNAPPLDNNDKGVAVEASLAPPAPLVAFISLSHGTIQDGSALYSDSSQQIGDETFPIVEVGTGEVAKYFSGRHDETAMPVGFGDGILNLSRLGFGVLDTSKSTFVREIYGMANAFEMDVRSDRTRRASIPIMWVFDDLVVTLTIAGLADYVLALLRKLPSLVDPQSRPSLWIEDLANAVIELAPTINAPIIWDGIDRGVIEFIRQGEVEVQFPISGPWMTDGLARLLSDASRRDDGHS